MKSIVEYMSQEDYDRYNELINKAEEAKANAPKAPRAPRTPMTPRNKRLRWLKVDLLKLKLNLKHCLLQKMHN